MNFRFYRRIDLQQVLNSQMSVVTVFLDQLYSTFAPAADSTTFGQLSDGVTRAALLRQLGSDTAPRTCNTVR